MQGMVRVSLGVGPCIDTMAAAFECLQCKNEGFLACSGQHFVVCTKWSALLIRCNALGPFMLRSCSNDSISVWSLIAQQAA